MNTHTPVRIPDPWSRALDLIDEAREERVWEALRAECEEEFEEWRAGDWRNREFADLSNWMVSKARWNRPNKYECALTYQERKLLGSAA